MWHYGISNVSFAALPRLQTVAHTNKIYQRMNLSKANYTRPGQLDGYDSGLEFVQVEFTVQFRSAIFISLTETTVQFIHDK